MGSEEVISAMHAATQKLIPEQMIQPQMMDTGPPLLYPIPKDPAQQKIPLRGVHAGLLQDQLACCTSGPACVPLMSMSAGRRLAEA